jgi:hypothetical protein
MLTISRTVALLRVIACSAATVICIATVALQPAVPTDITVNMVAMLAVPTPTANAQERFAAEAIIAQVRPVTTATPAPIVTETEASTTAPPATSAREAAPAY